MSKGYKFDSSNNVLGSRGKILHLSNDRGYPVITINFNGRIRNIRVHRLKAFFLYGEKIFEQGIDVRHLNGDKMDFSDTNLILGTPSQNSFDRPQKERIEHSKKAADKQKRFNLNEINIIKQKNSQGITSISLAKEYGVAKSTMSYILNNKTYRDVNSAG